MYQDDLFNVHKVVKHGVLEKGRKESDFHSTC